MEFRGQQHGGDNQGQQYRKPRNDAGKIFIGGLNWETTQEALNAYFADFGTITDCVVMKDHMTGFGFVTFQDPSVIDIVTCRDHFLDGKRIDPKSASEPESKSDQHDKIFVGGVHADVSEQEFNDFFAAFGAVREAHLMYDRETGRPRGFGFVTFVDGATAQLVISKQGSLFINSKSVEVKSAQPKQQAARNQPFSQAPHRSNQGQGYQNQGYDNQYQSQPQQMMYMNPMMMNQFQMPPMQQSMQQDQSYASNQSNVYEQKRDDEGKVDDNQSADVAQNQQQQNNGGMNQGLTQSAIPDFSQGTGTVDAGMMDAYFKMFYSQQYAMPQYNQQPQNDYNQPQSYNNPPQSYNNQPQYNQNYNQQSYDMPVRNQDRGYQSNRRDTSRDGRGRDGSRDRRDRSNSRERGREYKGRPRDKEYGYKTREERGEAPRKDEKKPYSRQ